VKGRGERIGSGGRGAAHWTVSNLTGVVCREAEIRRAIPLHRRGISSRGKGRQGRRGRGLYRRLGMERGLGLGAQE
jgi:hypothetical protein